MIESSPAYTAPARKKRKCWKNWGWPKGTRPTRNQCNVCLRIVLPVVATVADSAGGKMTTYTLSANRAGGIDNAHWV